MGKTARRRPAVNLTVTDTRITQARVPLCRQGLYLLVDNGSSWNALYRTVPARRSKVFEGHELG